MHIQEPVFVSCVCVYAYMCMYLCVSVYICTYIYTTCGACHCHSGLRNSPYWVLCFPGGCGGDSATTLGVQVSWLLRFRACGSAFKVTTKSGWIHLLRGPDSQWGLISQSLRSGSLYVRSIPTLLNSEITRNRDTKTYIMTSVVFRHWSVIQALVALRSKPQTLTCSIETSV